VKYKKKGSALIMVLALTIFIMGILGALFTLAINTINQINAYNRINSTYYAAESGIERTKKVFRDNGFSIFDNISSSNYDLSKGELEVKINSLATDYYSQLKSKLDSFGGENGNDENELVNSSDYYHSKKTKSYYNVTLLVGNAQVNMNNAEGATLKWKCTIPMTLTSEGIIDENGKGIIYKDGKKIGLPSKKLNYSANLVFYLDDIEITKPDKTISYVLKISDFKQPKVELN